MRDLDHVYQFIYSKTLKIPYQKYSLMISRRLGFHSSFISASVSYFSAKLPNYDLFYDELELRPSILHQLSRSSYRPNNYCSSCKLLLRSLKMLYVLYF